MDFYQPFRWAFYLFLIYSSVGILAWGFRVRLVNDKYEFRFPKRPWPIALVATTMMLLGMIPAYIGHFFGYMMLVVAAGAETLNFVQGMHLIYIEDPLPWVPLSNLSVLLAALAVWAFVDRYDTKRNQTSPDTVVNS